MFWTKDCGIFVSDIRRKIGITWKTVRTEAFIFYCLRHRNCSRIECSMTKVGCKKRIWLMSKTIWSAVSHHHPGFQCIKYRQLLASFENYFKVWILFIFSFHIKDWCHFPATRWCFFSEDTEKIIFFVNNSHSVIWNLLLN